MLHLYIHIEIWRKKAHESGQKNGKNMKKVKNF